MKRAISITVTAALMAPLAVPEMGYCVNLQCAPAANSAALRLPKPRLSSGVSVEKAILERRSFRKFRDEPLPLSDLSQLLWAAQGVTSPKGLRTAPSAGALYPLELYVVVAKVSGLAAGLYRYLPKEHALVPLRTGDCRGELNDRRIGEAPAALLFAADFSRTTGKYGERGRQYVFMDEGHASENVYLQAVALELGTVVIGGFDAAAVAKAFRLPGAQQPLSIMPIGKPKESGS